MVESALPYPSFFIDLANNIGHGTYRTPGRLWNQVCETDKELKNEISKLKLRQGQKLPSNLLTRLRGVHDKHMKAKSTKRGQGNKDRQPLGNGAFSVRTTADQTLTEAT